MSGQFEIGGITPSRYFYSIAVVLGLLFAMISVDEAKADLMVFLQWQLQTVVPMALLIGSHRVLLMSARFAALNPWLALCLSGVVGASLFSPIALFVEIWFETGNSFDLSAELLDEWIGVLPPVALGWLALNTPWVLGYRLEKPADVDNAVQTATHNLIVQPEFMSLLPRDKQGQLLWLKSELHYLQVVTERGSALILYNLADAIAQLQAETGMLVHRSYWVALAAIDELHRQGRQGELSLHDGQRIPVSRNRLAQVSARLAEASQAGVAGREITATPDL